MVTKMAAWKGATAGEKSGLPASAKRVVPHTQRHLEKRNDAEGPCLALAPGMAQVQEEEDVDVNLSEVYFLIMHFLSGGPCNRATGQLWNELLQYKLLPRRYHAWFSRTGIPSGDEDDDGISFPLSYIQVVERNPNIEKNHLVKLLRQQLIASRIAAAALEPPKSRIPTAADVPTVLGLGSYSLLNTEPTTGKWSTAEPTTGKEKSPQLLRQLRWPHWQTNQVCGLTLRELGGGFSRHHHAPSIRAASYAIMKPSILVDKIQIIKKFRGHQNAVYCAIFDRTGQHIITGSDDRLVKIWSTDTGFCLRSCRGHEGDITELSVSSGNALVASASNDCTIRVWRLPDGVPISVLHGHTGAVTAIAFSPRQSCEHHLLSSSDDGTCRIWDARDSSVKSRVYMPNTEASNPSAKPNVAVQPVQQAGVQFSCCAFNADGSMFVTGSSDRVARVWDARKWNDEITGKPNHELDVLKGHENAVNYVQFSGCAGPVKPNTTESAKEDRTTKFKNLWLTRDSIVTCSRDGSAIIWIYKSRRKDARYGRWMKAYHLRVPPPPMPSHPPRGGGPRQRFLPTPRGVNMIVWSLDNRFVLAAIMDCRICVWNAVDGSLVHSLTGHTKSTFVVDVHPFNPRIAMSAGYDGRVIIWDIWEGQPVRVYETGDFQIVDGNFSSDGTSLVVSDEVGQVYLLTTGQGQSQKDAKYDQFFLGDFRPLVRDIQGNVLDQETQLPPHQRNIQDLLCDANMIPYQEPYQSMYQQRRLGALGIDWQPLHVNLAVGTDDINYIAFVDHPLAFHPNIQGSPVNTAEDGARRWVEQPTDADEEMDWEQDITRLSDDSGSDYSVSEENLSLLDDDEGTASSTESMGRSDEEEGDREKGIQETQLRRSNRNKRKAEGTPSDCLGRKVGKLPPDLQQVDERIDEGTDRRPSRQRQADLESSAMRPASQQQLARPKRVAAKNALQLFSYISTNEDGDEEEASSSQQETSSRSTEQEPKFGGLSVSLPLSCNQKNDEDVYQTQEKDNVIEAEGREKVSESIGKEVMLETEEKGLKEDEREEDFEVQENPEKDGRGEDSRSNAQQESHTMYKKDEIFCEDENNEDFGMVPKEDALEKDISAARPDRSEPGDFSRRPRSQRRLVLKLWKNKTDIMESLNKVELEDTVSNGKIVTPKTNQIMTSRDHTKRKLRRLIVKPPQAAPLFHDGFGGLSDTGDNGDYSGIQNAGLLTSDHDQARLPGNHSRHSIRKKRKGKGQSVVVQVSNQAKGVHETVTVEPTGSSPSSLSCSNDRSASICGAYQDRSGEAPGGVALEISSHYRDTDSGGTNGARNLEAIPSHFNLPTREVEPPGRRLLEARLHRLSSPESSARFHPLNARHSNIYQRQEEAALQNDKLMIRSSIGVKSNQVDMNSQMNNAGCRRWHTTDHANRMFVEEPQQGDDGKTRNGLRGVSNGMDNAVHTRKGRKMFAHNTSEVVDEYDDSQFSQMMQEGGYQDHVSEIPLKSNAHSSSTKRTFVTKRFKSKEREVQREDSDGAVHGSSGDRDEAGQCSSEGHSESDFSQDNASWSELGSAEGGHSDAHYLRHKRRTLGEIESTNNTVQNFSEDLMGKRRVRHMRSVMLEGVRETRVKGNRWRRAAVNKEKEVENQGSSRRQRSWTDTMSWRNNYEGEDPGVHFDNAADRLTQNFGELHATNSYRSRGTDLGRFGQVRPSVPIENKGLRVSSRTRRERTRTSDRDQRRQVETITVMRDKGVRTRKSLAWLLLLEVEEGTRYIPQFGDEVAYLRQGHEEYLDAYKIDEPGPWTIYDDALLAVEICQVVGLEYAILVDSGETCCKLTLEFSDHTSQLQGKTFSLTLSELTNFPDFIVGRSRYDASIERRWTNRDRCKVWWRSQNGQGGEWWEGRVIAVKPKSFDFAESPWERFMVQYKSDPNKPYSHSPWELFDLSDARWEPPRIGQHMRERLLSVLESAANEPEDAYGLRKLKQSSCKSDFINRLPLPLTLDVLKQRLEKDYYHSSQAFYFDVQLLATNANTYCGVQHPMAQGLQAFARDMQKEISCESSS